MQDFPLLVGRGMVHPIEYDEIRCTGAFPTVGREELVQGCVIGIIQHQLQTGAIRKKQGTTGRDAAIIFLQSDDCYRDAVSIAAPFFVILVNVFLNDR